MLFIDIRTKGRYCKYKRNQRISQDNLRSTQAKRIHIILASGSRSLMWQMNKNSLFSRNEQEYLHIKVSGSIIFLPHKSFKQRSHIAHPATIPPRSKSTLKLGIPRVPKKLEKLFRALKVESRPDCLHSDIVETRQTNIGLESLLVRPVRSPRMRIGIVRLKVPTGIHPGSIEAQDPGQTGS